MRLTAEIRYDADPERVFAMLVDPGFQRAKCTQAGAIEHEVEITRDGEGAVVVTRRTLPTDGIPEAVRPFVGPTLRLRERQTWTPPAPDGSRSADFVVEIEGAPVRFTGTTRLSSVDGGVVQPVEGELKASVPLVGGRIERAAEPAVLAAVRAEQRAGTAWLAEH